MPTVAWAWAAGWALVAAGMEISDVYSSPNRGLLAAYSLAVAGWVIGASGTIHHLHRRGATASVIALSAGGWSGGAFLAVTLGPAWAAEWHPGYWGPIMSAALGGTVGGAFTCPLQSLTLSSPATAVRLGLQSAFAWGASFLLFQVLAFYVGYVLMQMTIDPLVPIVGHVLAGVAGWAIAAGLGGFLAARLALRHSQPSGSI